MQDGATPATPNWDIIRECYNNGLPLRQIAEKFGLQIGTVASRASRGNWKRIAAEAKAITHSVSISIPAKGEDSPESNHLTKASAAVKGSLANALLQAAGSLDTLPQSKSLKSRSANAQLMATLAGVGKTVFGWSEGQSQPVVRISLLGSAVISSDQPAIDVPSVPAIPLPPTD